MILQDAYRHCLKIATDHYENFPVLSRSLPRRLRPHVAAVYAFARGADDDADEKNPSEAVALARLEEKRRRIAGGNFDGDPVFEALGDTIRKFNVPAALFLDLLSAFWQDTERKRYDTFADILDYCSRSANPVGRIMLHLFGMPSAGGFHLSDKICTALQLANFWQDVRSDQADRDRIYIPQEDMRRFNVRESDLRFFGRPNAPAALRDLIDFEVTRAMSMMREGWGLVRLAPFRFKIPIALFAAGGTVILRGISAGAPRPRIDCWGNRIRLPVEVLKVMSQNP